MAKGQGVRLMASTVGTRRSPRSIKNLCHGLLIPDLSSEQTATVLALAHCTGWSADTISNKVAEIAGVKLSAELIWDHHWSWVFGRGGTDKVLPPADWNIMQILMKNIGVDLDKPGRPLSKTLRPTTVKFAHEWPTKDEPRQPLFGGWTSWTRDVTKGYLLREGPDAYGRLTQYEEDVMAVFGEGTLCIIRNTLKAWTVAMSELLHAEPGLRPIRERQHVDLIMQYLKVFEKSYEDKFGKMHSGKHPPYIGDIKDDAVFIKSTGYGVKVLLGLTMADRMHVVERRRKIERESLGFLLVKVEDLEHDSKNCPICQDPMGVESVDGTKEDPIRLVICCGQVIGSECLKTWLGEFVFDSPRDTCPICRFQFPSSFIGKLFTAEELVARDASGDEELSLQSSSPNSARPMRSQQEQDGLLQQQSGGVDLSNEQMEIDDMMGEVGPLLATPPRLPRQTGLGRLEGFGFVTE